MLKGSPRPWLVPLGLLFLALDGCGSSSSLSIPIKREMIQATLASYFPLSSDKPGQGGKQPLRVTLADPEALLEPGSDRLGLRVRIVVERLKDEGPPLPPLPGGGPPKSFTGTLVARGAISYQPEKAAFFYSNPTIQELNFPQLPPPFEAPAREIAEGLLAHYLQANPIYTLSDNLQSRATKWMLKSVVVRDGTMIVEVGP